MKDAIQFLLQLRRIGVSFTVEGESLVCQAPPGAMTGAIQKKIAKYKPELLSLIKAQDDHRNAKLLAAERPTRIPLSFAQERLWFLAQLGAGDQYHITYLLQIWGSLDKAALEKTLNFMVARHESLRTSFSEKEGLTFQVVENGVQLPFQYRDLSGLAQKQRKHRSKVLLRDLAQDSFCLQQAPLFRVALLKMSDNSHIFGFCMHHIVADGWSIGILIREINQVYPVYRSGGEPDLADIHFHYADYAIWQRKFLTTQKLELELCYWHEKLRGYQDLALPTDFARPKQLSGRGEHVVWHLPEQEFRNLKDFCRGKEVTLASALITAAYVLLKIYGGQSDLCFGMPVANRSQIELEGLIGPFINTIVVRVNPVENQTMTLELLLEEVYRQVLNAQDWQSVPFEKVVERIQPERVLNKTPIFQTLVNYYGMENPILQFDECQVARLDSDIRTSKFDLTMGFSNERDGSLRVNLGSSQDLFTPETIGRMGRHLLKILSNMASHPNQDHDGINLLDPEEKQMLLSDWNHRARGPGVRGNVLELFEAQRARTPDTVALVFGVKHLTYSRLDSAANQVALQLRGLGLKPDTLVGISMQRSIEMLVALFGILKSDAAYVPIDPNYPDARLAHMAKDSGLNLLLTQNKFRARFESIYRDLGCDLVCLDGEPPKLPGGIGPRPKRADLGNLIYVIYTSGSTGKPKGVLVEHRGVANYLIFIKNFIRDSGLKPETAGFSFFGNLAFDATATSFLTPLISGGTCVIYGHRRSLSNTLNRVLDDARIHLVKLSPAHLELLRDRPPGRLAYPKGFILGGEPLPTQLLRDVFNSIGEPLFCINQYGPTECTIAATVHRWEKARTYARIIPIGIPIKNTQVFVLDRHKRLVPIGVCGELYIGGSGVALGYLNMPRLTAERFVENPYETNGRLFRTGDWVRWLTDGNLEFLGRMDHQVKIRGYRVECGEIEHLLSDHPDIRSAAVILAKGSAEGRLVAYYVSSSEGNHPDHDALRTYLLKVLPDYMVPSAFVCLERLPLNASGKLDRRDLAGRDVTFVSHVPFEAPRTPTEKQVAAIWSDLLGVARIGVHDNFFQLGGHSLLAIKIVSRIEASMGRAVGLRRLFEAPTVARFARELDHSETAEAPAMEVAQRPAELPLSFSQERLWFLAQLGYSGQYHMPKLTRVNGLIDGLSLQAGLGAMICRHESLRTGFRNVDGRAVQEIEPKYRPELWRIDLSGLENTDRKKLCTALLRRFIHRPFDLSKPPLMRSLWIQLPGHRHLFALCLHHMISDGWSMSILTREIGAAYRAFCLGREPRFPELELQYADYTLWQRRVLSDAYLEKGLAYWHEQLSDYRDLMLPTDRPRPRQLSGRGGHSRLLLDPHVSSALRAFCSHHEVTKFALLLAALYVLLGRYSGQTDLCVGIPVANRSRTELEGIVGFFVNTLVIRIGQNPALPFRGSTLLKQVHETVLSAQEHQEIPFEKIVEHIGERRDMRRSPLFQVMASYGTETQGLALDSEPKSPWDPEHDGLKGLGYGIAKFELTVNFIELEQGLVIAIEYSRDLYEQESVRRMGAHLSAIVAKLVATPERSVARLEFLSSSEKQKLLSDWNDTAVPLGWDKTIHQQYEAQSLQTPDKMAVVLEHGQLTYGALNRLSNQWAQIIHGGGVGPGSLVGICLEPSLEMVIGILAILKTGAAYVPLDPHYPEDRIRYMARDARLETILTQVGLREKVRRLGCNGPIISLDEGLPPHGNRAGSIPVHLEGAGVAYVIYTSGSTGHPKGVLVGHRGVVNTVDAVAAQLPVNPRDRCLQTVSFCFDGSVVELFTVLLHSATLVLLPESRKEPKQFSRYVAQLHVNVAMLLPVFLEILKDEPLPGLKRLFTGGEAVLKESIHYPEKTYLNLYGPTESSIVATTEKFVGAQYRSGIGTPIANTRVYLLDEHLQLAPMGVPGELYLAGAGLALGYLNNPKLTCQRFVANPFETGSRMYRTGDMARWLGDGHLAFLGRRDYQIKIRGFRVECGEIERALLTYDGVDEAAVISRSGEKGPALVAYYVPTGGRADIAARQFRVHLQNRLPEYMIPSAFIPLEALPVNPVGKVDRLALTAREVRFSSEREYLAPRNDTDRRLAAIWSEVLGVEKVGLLDNFFELGGHSIIAIRMMAKIQDQFSVELSLGTLFQSPNLMSLSEGIASAERMVEEDQLAGFVESTQELKI